MLRNTHFILLYDATHGLPLCARSWTQAARRVPVRQERPCAEQLFPQGARRIAVCWVSPRTRKCWFFLGEIAF